MIMNPDVVFSIKTHGHIGLFTYPSFNKYSLKRLCYMHPDCFNPYNDLCNLIRYNSLGFELNASDILNPLGISYKYRYQATHINKL